MIEVTTGIDPSIQRALAKAEMGPLRRFLRKSTKGGARPVLAAVRERTPVLTGKLRASWGIKSFYDSRTGSVGVTVEPRSSFTFRDEAGNKRLVTRRGRAHKSVIAAAEKGITVDRDDAWKYAYGVEMGHSPKGRLTRRAGGAKMLEKGIQTGEQSFITTVSDDLWKYIASGV